MLYTSFRWESADPFIHPTCYFAFHAIWYGVHTSFEKTNLLCYSISLLITPPAISLKRGKAR